MILKAIKSADLTTKKGNDLHEDDGDEMSKEERTKFWMLCGALIIVSNTLFKMKKGIIDTAVHWFACCVSIDGLDISSNGGRVGDGTERTERRCVLRCWWVAPIFFGGVGLPSPYLV